MPKLNVSGLPDEPLRAEGPFSYQVGGQEYQFWLRRPNYPDLLAVDTLAQDLERRLKPAVRYPVPGPPIFITPFLCTAVALLLSLLCDPDGRPLPKDEAYVEGDLFPMSVKSATAPIFKDLQERASELYSATLESLGNGLGAAGVSSSAPPSITELPAIPNTSDTSSGRSGPSTSDSADEPA